MPYLIDSDWAIDYLDGVENALGLLDRLAEEGIAISIVTYLEIYQGVLRAPDPTAAAAQLAAFLDAVPTLPLSPAVARRCARLRETVRKQGKRVNARALDLLNAAIALEHDLTMVTRNLGDYDDIPGLKLYRAS